MRNVKLLTIVNLANKLNTILFMFYYYFSSLKESKQKLY